MAKKRIRIDESVVAAHADEMARIVPMLGIEDLAAFWRRIRAAWSPERLEDALRLFRDRGDMSAFLELVREDPRTPMGHWRAFENVDARLRQVMADTGKFPTLKDLNAQGLSGLASAIHDYHVGLSAVRRRMGVPLERAARGEWMDFANVERTLREVEARSGRFPTAGDLKKAGYPGLVAAASAYHGGLPAIRERMGIDRGQKKIGHWQILENVEAVLRAETVALGRFPREVDLTDRGHSSVASAIARHHGGMDAMRRRLGAAEGERPKGYWKSYERVEEAIVRRIAALGHFPTQKELGSAGLSSVAMAAGKYHGSLLAVRHRMGYGPVTDETISAHADALAAIIPALGQNPADLWHRMKRSWTTRDLDAAIATYVATGSLDAFRRLLDG